MDLSPDSRENPEPMSSPVRDARQLQQNAGDTAAELRSFLAELRGKSPKEMLGVIATSNLAQSLVQASLLVAVIIVVFTVLPFAWEKVAGTEVDAGSVEKTVESGLMEATPPVAVAEKTEARISGLPEEPPAAVSPERSAAETLGIGETKTAPLDSNPLDSAEDDLLEGLE